MLGNLQFASVQISNSHSLVLKTVNSSVTEMKIAFAGSIAPVVHLRVGVIWSMTVKTALENLRKWSSSLLGNL